MAVLPSYPEAALQSLTLQEELRGLWCVVAWFLLSWRELGAGEVTSVAARGHEGQFFAERQFLSCYLNAPYKQLW